MKRLLLATLLTALLPLSAHANLISNGNFASNCADGNYCTYNAGNSTDIFDWTVGGGSVDLITGYWQSPPAGGHSVDLDGFFQVGSVSTTFATSLGKKYVVTFALSGNPDGGASLKQVQVSAGSASDTFAFNTNIGNVHANMMYDTHELEFIALGGSTILNFQSLSLPGSAFGPAIGNVDVSAVPEPATLSLFGAGLAGFAAFRRRRKAKA